MVVELAEVINEIDSDDAAQFVEDLYYHLDPFLAWEEQQTEEQRRWLYSLYEKFVNHDEEAARQIYEE